MAMEAFEQSNGFSALTADELFFVNGGSSNTRGRDVAAGACMVEVGATLVKGAATAMNTGTVAGVITGVAFGLIGVAIIGVGVDLADGNGLDKTQAIINGMPRK
jgi:hypothetical protein